MPEGNVIVVDPYSSGAMFAAALSEQGYLPVAVTTSVTPPEIYEDSYKPDGFPRRFVCDAAADDLLPELRQLAPKAVIAGAETGVELADRLAEKLTPELANDPYRTAARRHKGKMARAVADAGIPTIPTMCSGDENEVADWLAASGLSDQDIVLKPPRSAGGNGFTLVPAGGDWRTPFRRLVRSPDQYRNLDGEVVVQQHVSGIEYAVDTVSCRGQHAVTTVCRYGKTGNPRHAAVYRSIEYLPYDLPGHREILDYVRRVLDALGIRFGAAHTEVMVTSEGVRLIETGARVAGGGLPATSRLATGHSPVDRLVSAIDGRLGRTDYDMVLPVMVAFFIARQDGIAVNAEVFDAVRELDSHRFSRIGFRTGEMVSSTADLITTMKSGWTLLANPDRLRLYADYRAVLDIERSFMVEPVG